MGELSEAVKDIPKKCWKKYGLFWTTIQAQKVTLHMISWCLYQSDQVTGLNTYIPTKAPIPDAILDVVEPVFTCLEGVTFLEQCKNCNNLIAIEFFSSVVCSLSPKETLNSLIKNSLAINLAACLFNDGFEFTLRSTLSAAGLSFTECSLQQWRNIDNERIENGDYVMCANPLPNNGEKNVKSQK